MNQGYWLRVLGISLLLSPSPTAWAGAWTLPKNRWYVEYFYRYLGSKHVFDSEGSSNRRTKTALFSDIRNEWKLEYGLTDWWSLLASAPYISSHYRDDNVDLLRTGVGDIYVRSKFRFLNRPILSPTQPLVGSAQFSAKIPSAYDPNKNPLGDGQVDFESRLQLSQSWTFAPYAVAAPQHTASGVSLMRSSTVLAASQPVNREEAMRDAVLLAELIQHGKHLYAAQQYEEAATWFQAALESNPSNEEVLHLVFNHAVRAIAEASTDGTPEAVIASKALPDPPADEPFVPSVAVERRYAKVAFVNLEGGFTARTEEPANEFPLFVEVGLTPLKRLMLVGSLDAVVSA
ncbi:MAG: tetratricopeptide repeat protein, partial [Candidatus Omnitrophica bacterium]|nr:tetratricopeptide repeat protein [Candidatus Omnitrophota bacterium]